MEYNFKAYKECKKCAGFNVIMKPRAEPLVSHCPDMEGCLSLVLLRFHMNINL